MAGITLISALVSLVFNFILIPLADDFGAAVSLNLSIAFILILYRSAVRKEYGAFFPNDKVVILILSGITLVLINFMFFMTYVKMCGYKRRQFSN